MCPSHSNCFAWRQDIKAQNDYSNSAPLCSQRIIPNITAIIQLISGKKNYFLHTFLQGLWTGQWRKTYRYNNRADLTLNSTVLLRKYIAVWFYVSAIIQEN